MKHMVRGIVCLAFAAGMSFAASAETTVSNWTDLLTAVGTASDGDVIILAAGDYTVVDSGVTLSSGVTVRGATGDPKDVTIKDSVSGKRAFTLEHQDARIEALTITGTGLNLAGGEQGGHLYLTAGTVRNCVIQGGTVGPGNSGGGYGGNVYMTGGVVEDSTLQKGWVGRRAYGGNVYMTGGTVRRCEIREGTAHSSAGNNTSYSTVAAGVYASGGLIDSCLLADNKVTRNGYCGGMYLSGSATAVNCTVVGSRVDATDNPSAYYLSNGFGVQIASKTAKVINTVMYDNGGDAQKEFGTANLTNYVNCASSIANESDAGWQTISADDFMDYGSGDCTLPLESKLVDKGTLEEDVYPIDASATDLLGNARVSVTIIDIGCYETDKSQAACSGLLSAYGAREGEEVVCSATATEGVGASPVFKWDFGNGEVRTTDQADYSYAYPTSGLFTVSVMASGDGGSTWVATNVLLTKMVVIPETMYVNSTNTAPVFPFKTPETAATTLKAAMNAMTNDNSDGISCCVSGAVVRIMKSDTALTDSGMVLDNAVVIRGETDDPADAVITASTYGKRAFTLKNDEALIENLTVGGSGARVIDGGHVSVTRGTVRNCIIENGQGPGDVNNRDKRGVNVFIEGGIVEDSVIRGAKNGFKTFGGNVAMAGGRVRRCKILNGTAYSGAGTSSNESRGGGVYMTDGILEDCLLANNVVGRFSYTAGIYLAGAGTVVNCTVVNSTVNYEGKEPGSSSSYGVGIHIASASGRVVNTVVYDNGGDAQKEYGTENLTNYFNCASSVDNESDEGWQTIDEKAFTSSAQGDYTLPLTSKLVDKGTLADGVYPADASTTDLLGNARVSVTLIDIGCYEADKSKASCNGYLSDYAVLEGADVTCSAEAAGMEGDIIYKWNFGNGAVVTTNLANFAYTYPNAGLFTVSVSASGDEGATWTAPSVLPTKIVVAPSVMYVDSESENPLFPYKGKDAAAKTIKDALNAMTNNDSKGVACVPGVEIRIASGSRLTDSGMVLDVPIVIRGESDNPTNVVISNSGSRAFTVNCDDARVESLTITGKGRVSTGNCGGHLYLTAGTVRNCIIENGAANKDNGAENGDGGNVYMTGGILEDSVICGGFIGRRAKGGNVCMTGGRVRRCRILKGTAYSNANLSSGGYESRGGGVYISGGVLENCLVASNVVGRFSYTAGIYLDGAGTVVNCTVVGGTVTSTEQSGSFANVGVGIHIADSKGRVVNTVVYDNGGTAQTEFGTGSNLAYYDYCASSVANESAAHWTTITAADFSDYAAWTGKGAVEGLRPSRRSGEDRLINAGTKWDEYLGIGATSTTDLCGGERLLGRRIDIGCLENLKLGLMLFVR